jgi:hypothetical protein
LAQSDGFIREVDDALRQDEALDLYKRYGKQIAAAVLLALAVFAGYLIWDHYQQAARAERAEKFTIALDQLESGGLDAAAKAAAPLAASGGDGSQAAARMLLAGIAEEQGKAAEAVKGFDAVAADSTAPQPYRDLATIRSVALRFDSLAPATVVSLMKPLAEPGKPWFGSAGELLGLAYIKQGNNTLAGPLFAAISRDKTAPESLRRRTRQMAGLLGVDAIDDVNEAAASNGGGNSGANGPAQAAQ